MRQVLAGSRAAVAELSDNCKEIGGKLDVDKLCIGRPEFRAALGRGIKFWVAHWMADFIWPMLADYLQDTLKITAKLIVSESELMLKLNQMAVAAAKRGEELNWKAYELAAARSNPTCSSWINVLSEFVQKNGGGLDGQLLSELAEFPKASKMQGLKGFLEVSL